MLQVRKLVLAVAAVTATAFTSSYTHALGLGDIAIKSSLNQPLEAEISLQEVRDLTAVEIKTRLASPEEFSKAGVDRQFFLTGLSFTPVIDAKGKNVIRVTSQQPVKEPYLNFLVEVIWPNGRLLREYTLLLDPPLYAPQQVVYAPKPAVTAAPTPVQRTAQPAPRAPQPVARPARAAQVPAPVSGTLQGDQYRVQRNDTLWEIAMRVEGNASIHQTMLAIQDLNPDAFIGGNINRMKSGQVLRLPSAQDLTKRSRAEALAQVNQQTESWRTGRATPPALAERQLDATHREQAGAAPAAIDTADSLRLVADAPGQAQQAADEGTSTAPSDVQDQLARTKELLDSTRLENQELHSRVDDLNSQLNKLQRLIELKDNQLAQLQNAVDTPIEFADSEDSIATAATEQIEDVLTTAAAQEPVSAEETDSADLAAASPVDGLETDEDMQASAAVEPTDAEEGDAVVAADETLGQEADLVAEAEDEPEPALVAEPAAEVKETEEPKPAPTPAVTEPVAKDKNIVATIMDNPTLLAAAGGSAILGLLLVLVGLSRSRARKEAALYEQELAEQSNLDGVVLDSEQDDPLSLDVLDETAAEQDEQLSAAAVTETQFKQEETDPLAEADSYIGFGRYSEAAEVLNKAIEQQPERIDLRHKLLEVYAALEDQTSFSRQVNEITEIGGAAAGLAQIKSRYPHMFGAEQVADVSLGSDFADLDLDDFALDTAEEPTSTVATEATELDAELDELSTLLADAQSSSPDEQAVTDFDFDLDLDLSEPVETAATETPQAPLATAAEQTDEFALDFDSLDLDLERSAAAETASTTSESEFTLDDLSQELDDTEFKLADDFDFSVAETEKQAQDVADFDLQLDDLNLDEEASSLSPASSANALDDSAQELDSLLDSVLAETTQTAGSTPVSDHTELGDLESLDGIDDDFGFLSGTDETATKLDLARAYIDMGDAEGARDILEEVVSEGTTVQQDEARELINQLG